MTAHAHDQSKQSAPTATGSARPRWLLPALAGGAVLGALVVLGVLPPSVVLYGGLLGGMVLMHVGGHGGHGDGGGHGGPGGHQSGGPASDGVDLTRRSPGSQPSPSTFGEGFDERTANAPIKRGTHDDDQRSSHTCH